MLNRWFISGKKLLYMEQIRYRKLGEWTLFLLHMLIPGSYTSTWGVESTCWWLRRFGRSEFGSCAASFPSACLVWVLESILHNPPIFGPVYHQLSPSQHVATYPSTALGGPSGAQATPHSMQGAALLHWVFRDGHRTKYHMWRTNVDEHPSMIIYASYIDVNRRVPGFWSIATFLHVLFFYGVTKKTSEQLAVHVLLEIDFIVVTFDMNFPLFGNVFSSNCLG